MKYIFGSIVIVAILVSGVCAFAYAKGGIMGFRWWSWHQKLTIEVMTPGGLKTASAVTEASWSMPATWFKIGDSGGGLGLGELKGEAVVLELEPGRYLFALLKDYSAMTAVQAFANPGFQSGKRSDYIAVLDRLALIRETRELRYDQYPLLMTFDNVDNPASVRRAEPRNLAATFGDGYHLNAVNISITEEPVTKGRVGQLLPWLSSFYSKHLDGNPIETIHANNQLANSLASGAFDTEKSR